MSIPVLVCYCCCSVAQSCSTLCGPMDCGTAGLSVPHHLPKFAKFIFVASVMPSSHLILWCPLLLPSIFPSIRVFSNESALHIRWSFSFSISPSNEYSGLISFRTDWFDLLTVQGTLKIFSSTTVWKHQFFSTQTSLWSNCHIYTWLMKTTTLTINIFVGKVMSLLFNMLSRLVMAFLPRSKCLLISWLQSPSAVILDPKKIKSVTVSNVSPTISHEVMGPAAMIFVFWMLSFKPDFFILLFHLHQEAL